MVKKRTPLQLAARKLARKLIPLVEPLFGTPEFGPRVRAIIRENITNPELWDAAYLRLVGKNGTFVLRNKPGYKPNKHQRIKRKKLHPGMLARRAKYETYLQSPQWAIFRMEIRMARGGRCEKCGSTQNLHVHHLTYKRLGKELPEDVQLLCRMCHEAAHGRSFTA